MEFFKQTTNNRSTDTEHDNSGGGERWYERWAIETRFGVLSIHRPTTLS